MNQICKAVLLQFLRCQVNLESQQTFLGSVKLQLATEEDKVGGTDLAAALSRLSDAENARTATLQAAGQIARVNLFDFLK